MTKSTSSIESGMCFMNKRSEIKTNENSKLKAEIKLMRSPIQDLTEWQLDLQTCSMHDNLIFTSIREEDAEDTGQGSATEVY